MTTKRKTSNQGTLGTAPGNPQHNSIFRVEFLSKGIPCSTLALGSDREEVWDTYNKMNTPSEPITVKSVTAA